MAVTHSCKSSPGYERLVFSINNMNYSSLTTEQRAALDSLKASYCKTSKQTSITDAEFETLVMTGLIECEAKRLFDLAVQHLAEGAKAMSYDDRVALIQNVESQIAP